MGRGSQTRKSHGAEKREVPDILKTILNFDIFLTNQFCNLTSKILPLRNYRTHYMCLEYSCHGIPWLAGWLALIWILGNVNLFQLQVNFFIGLIVDIIVVAVIKAVTRRRRPSGNEKGMFGTVSVDKFSFPSGHATRSVYIAHFFTHAYPLNALLSFLIISWAAAVCASRVLLRRHHVLDVLAGVVIGILESYFIQWVWLSRGTCVALLSWLTEEQFEGGEFHV